MKFVARGRKASQAQGKGPVCRAAYCCYVSKDGGAFDEAGGRLTTPRQIARQEIEQTL